MNSSLITQSTELQAADSFCANCGRERSPHDNFCGRCGRSVKVVDQAPITAELLQENLQPNQAIITLSPGVQKFLNNRLLIWLCLACVGPVGLPALWFSERYSTTSKVVISVLFLAATILVPIGIALYWLEFSVRPLVDVMQNR